MSVRSRCLLYSGPIMTFIFIEALISGVKPIDVESRWWMSSVSMSMTEMYRDKTLLNESHPPTVNYFVIMLVISMYDVL